MRRLFLAVVLCFLSKKACGWHLASSMFPQIRTNQGKITSILLKASGPEDTQEQARKLREEIDAFEKQRTEQADAVKRAKREEKMALQKTKSYYTAILPILKPDGTTADEKIEFMPVSKQENTCIVVIEGSLPLGMILEEGEISGTTVVSEVTPDSNAALAGVQMGDILRACTACKMEMEAPTWQLLAGGIGRPKTVRMIYATDFKPFEEIMEAIGSNRMDPDQRPALLVLERKRQ